MDTRQRWIDSSMGDLDLDQKIGQVMVFGFCGTQVTPDVIDLITRHHLGGLRISQGFRMINLSHDIKPGSEPEPWQTRSIHPPAGLNRDFSSLGPPTRVSPRAYALLLNRLRRLALERPGGIPLHYTMDQEGNASDDFLFGARLLPHAGGIAATGDPAWAEEAARTIAAMLRGVGVNMIHSPVLDVNTNPRNPEVGTRSYGANPDIVGRYALRALAGFEAGGLISTGKHFPGRGESITDAHWGMPSVDLSREDLERDHLAPYRTLIEAGLPAIMMAHCRYPALSDNDLPASCDPAIIKGLLRNEMGFTGIITTDNMMMGGLLQRYELGEAVVETLKAGCDLVLLRDESPIRWRIFEQVREAVRSGAYPEADLDSAVQRVLGMRYDMGLVSDGGLVDAEAADHFDDPAVVASTRALATRSTMLIRDDAGTLPLALERPALLIEQVFPSQLRINGEYSHPGLLWDELNRLAMGQVAAVEVAMTPSPTDIERVRRRLDEPGHEVVIITNYYYHKSASANDTLVAMALATGRPVIVISNTHYPTGVPDQAPTVLATFNPGGREHLRVIAEAIYGRSHLTGQVE